MVASKQIIQKLKTQKPKETKREEKKSAETFESLSNKLGNSIRRGGY